MKINRLDSLRFNQISSLHLPCFKKRKIAVGVIAVSIMLLMGCSSYPSNTNKIVTPSAQPSSSANDKDYIPPLCSPIEESEDIEIIEPSHSDDINIEVTPNTSVKEIPDVIIEITPEPLELSPTNQDNTIVEVQSTKMVALSFDDGPSKYTLEILNILKENDCTATFFVVGNKTNQYSDIILEVYQAGNEIGNHSFNHSDFTKLSPEEIMNQFNTTEEAIYNVIDVYPIFFRPPYGAINNTVKENIASPLALWSIDSNDWQKITDEEVINNIIPNLADGKIILMHDIFARTAKLCQSLIPTIKNLGYNIVSISELYESNEFELQDGVVYSLVKKN